VTARVFPFTVFFPTFQSFSPQVLRLRLIFFWTIDQVFEERLIETLQHLTENPIGNRQREFREKRLDGISMPFLKILMQRGRNVKGIQGEPPIGSAGKTKKGLLKIKAFPHAFC
jgi:hypothetical protein